MTLQAGDHAFPSPKPAALHRDFHHNQVDSRLGRPTGTAAIRPLGVYRPDVPDSHHRGAPGFAEPVDRHTMRTETSYRDGLDPLDEGPALTRLLLAEGRCLAPAFARLSPDAGWSTVGAERST